MSPRNLLWFYRRRIRARLVQELLALVGIAIGVSLLFAVQVSNRSLSASIAQLTHGLVGNAQLQLVARDPHGFSERVAEAAARIDGVKAVAPMLQTQANIVGPGGQRAVTLLAADPTLARLGGHLLNGYTAGRLASIHALVLPAPIAHSLSVRFGETVTLQVRGRSLPAPVGAIVGRGDVGLLADSPVVVAPLTYGQTLAESVGQVSRVFVLTPPGREATVRAALRRLSHDRFDVRTADSEGRLFAEASTPNDQSTALFAGISALVGFLFAFNSMLLMARERRGVIAELRMSGYGFRAVLQVIMLDALVLGLAASCLGLVIGDQLSRHVFHPSPGYLSIAFPVGNARSVDWSTIGIALASGTLAALLATLIPLVGAFTAPALDAVEQEDSGEGKAGTNTPRLLLASLAALTVTTLVLLLAPHAAAFGMVALVASMLLLLPVVLVHTLALAGRLRRRVKSVVPAIAIGELLSARSRSTAIAAIAAIAVFGSTAIEGAHRDLQSGLDPNARELNDVADLWISPAGAANTLATMPFRPDTAIATLAKTPHVAAVHIYRGGFIDIGDRRVWVIAPPTEARQPIPPSQVITGDVALAARRVRQGGWATLSEAVARQEGVHVGETFTVESPRPTRFRLAAVTTNFGWSPGTMVLNAREFGKAWATTDASALQVDLTGISAASGRRLIQAALGPDTGLAVQTAAQRQARDQTTTRQGLSRLTDIATLMLLAAGLAMAAAMGGMVWQRRRRLADLKLAGINHRQLWLALLLESALLLAIGGIVGAVYGLYGEQLLNRALNVVTGFPVSNSIGVTVALISLAVVTTVAWAVAMLPGYLAARVPADVAFRD